MQLANEIALKQIKPSSDGKIVEYIAVKGGWKKLDKPTLSTEIDCVECGSKEHYAVYTEMVKDAPKVRICGNMVCVLQKPQNIKGGMIPLPTPKRVQEHALFCELNGIGDVHHDVSFEKIEQSPEIKRILYNFAENPEKILFLQGTPGTGKTYACLGVCELFTRKSSSVIFLTDEQMNAKWSESLTSEPIKGTFSSRLKNCNLLIIDDFGTAEPTEKYMRFFMGIIDHRLQWKGRGTIITTNLENDKFSSFCGQALADRIKTGQKIILKHKSRR